MVTSLSTAEPPSNTIPWAHLSSQPKLHLYRFSRICTDDRRVSLYFTMGAPLFSLETAPSHGGSGPPFNTLVPWAHPSPQPKRHLNLLNRFCRDNDHDRQTDLQTTEHSNRSVTISRINVCSTAMRPKNGAHDSDHTQVITQ